ncbi:opticin [Centrocercus urophasianus]|uniref:opticin n=1 Tax=Centrocercus urophasianus TaxID=9002 RepID=UPI001C6471BE|nr:opticin [Centrocercus urophasianus]XP_042740384.1 opticin [Lagopus leucura]
MALGHRMQTLAWVGIASLCLGATWAVPAKKERKKVEKPKPDLVLYENLDLENYDMTLDSYGDIMDLNNYEELYDYGDLAPKIEVGTLAPRPKDRGTLPELGTAAPTPKLQPLATTNPTRPAPPGPNTAQGLPSCLRCLCIRTSVYCDDTDLEHIPPLPPDTTYLYARFNRIGAIRAGDFMGLKKLKRIDLTSNSISWADVDAFRLLPSLQELILPENRLTALPELPRSIVRLDARLNRIPSAGLRPEAFQDLTQLQFLHLSDNQLDYIPAPLPESLRSLHLQNNNIQTMHEDTFCNSQDQSHIRRALEDIRLDGNPINLSLFPNAYFCLPRLPTGRFL